MQSSLDGIKAEPRVRKLHVIGLQSLLLYNLGSSKVGESLRTAHKRQQVEPGAAKVPSQDSWHPRV